MIKTTSIDSLTNFQKNAKTFTARLEETKEPLVLTINGKAKLVVQDADAYQALLDEVEQNRFLEAVRQGFGLACVLADYTEAGIAVGSLVRVLDDWCPPFPGYHLYYPSRRQSSAAFSLLVDALRYRG